MPDKNETNAVDSRSYPLDETIKKVAEENFGLRIEPYTEKDAVKARIAAKQNEMFWFKSRLQAALHDLEDVREARAIHQVTLRKLDRVESNASKVVMAYRRELELRTDGMTPEEIGPELLDLMGYDAKGEVKDDA